MCLLVLAIIVQLSWLQIQKNKIKLYMIKALRLILGAFLYVMKGILWKKLKF